MNTIDASLRNTKTSGEVNKLRSEGNVPGIVYGGKSETQKISISKKLLKNLIEKENFLSSILNLKIDGKDENVLPKEISYDILTDDPIHIDFLRIVKGSSVIIEIPVNFINTEKSPGLKRGGVLNIVRRKVELKCPSENIPSELVVDLDGVDIGHSFKISSIKLPENVEPTIRGRDFVIATVAAPTVIKEPEKPAETEEGAEGAEAAAATGEGGAETGDAGGLSLDQFSNGSYVGNVIGAAKMLSQDQALEQAAKKFADPEKVYNKKKDLVLSNKILVWFGLISFPLYLWHWPLISFARIVESDFPNENYRVISIIVSIILSWITYKYLEKAITSRVFFNANGDFLRDYENIN